MRTVVFDLDGTLVDTSGDLIAAANSCFRARGLGDVLDTVADARVAFNGGRAMLREGFARTGAGGEAEVDEDYHKLLAAYGDNIAVHSRAYDGAWSAVETLKQRGFAVAICTNKPEGLARQLLDTLGTAHVLPTLIGADTLPQATLAGDADDVRQVVFAAGIVVTDGVDQVEQGGGIGADHARVAQGDRAFGLCRVLELYNPFQSAAFDDEATVTAGIGGLEPQHHNRGTTSARRCHARQSLRPDERSVTV